VELKTYGPPHPAFQRRFSAPAKTPSTAKMPHDLAQVVAAWRHLPEAVRAGILAMVTASRE